MGTAEAIINYSDGIGAADFANPGARNYKNKMDNTELVITLENSTLINRRNESSRSKIAETQAVSDVKLQ